MRVWARWAFGLLLLVLAVWLQTSVLPVFHVPGRYVPLAVMVMVIACRNFTSAFAVGFGLAAGFMMDTVPPAPGPLGVHMLTATFVAMAVSTWAYSQRADAAGITATWVAVIAFTIGFTALRIIVGSIAATGMTFASATTALVKDGLLAAVLAPVLVPAIDFCLRPRASERSSAYVSWSR